MKINAKDTKNDFLISENRKRFKKRKDIDGKVRCVDAPRDSQHESTTALKCG